MEAFSQNGDSVTLNLKGPDGERETVRADWLVACDGGASFIRRTLNIPFEGKTAPNQWIVIDIANDPLATPHVYLCCDPVRPYVSAALPHGVRRFEFMVMPGETEAQLSEPHNMRRLLSKVLPDPDRVELIRQRVYTHNARLAERFRIDRVLLAGDAAHIMPVWQGQGYNSGMRDAFNLAWKLALVVNGKAGETLLDSYQQERRDHAKAMIDLSVTAGYVLAPPKRWQGAVRDGLSWLLNYLPPVKRYFLEMRFKPMPQYREGAADRRRRQDLAGGQNVYSTAGDAGERRERAARRGYRGEFRHYRLGLQPAVGARRRADRPLARDWRALYPGGARGADPSRAG